MRVQMDQVAAVNLNTSQRPVPRSNNQLRTGAQERDCISVGPDREFLKNPVRCCRRFHCKSESQHETSSLKVQALREQLHVEAVIERSLARCEMLTAGITQEEVNQLLPNIPCAAASSWLGSTLF